MTGYSGTPLAKKLGIKEGFRVRTIGAPKIYLDLVDPLPQNVRISNRGSKDIDIWHFFTKSSGVSSNVTEDVIREVALPLGLVDIKVCAVDNTWSGLNLVIRKELRKRNDARVRN